MHHGRAVVAKLYLYFAIPEGYSTVRINEIGRSSVEMKPTLGGVEASSRRGYSPPRPHNSDGSPAFEQNGPGAGIADGRFGEISTARCNEWGLDSSLGRLWIFVHTM